MIKSILVPLDTSEFAEQALPHAVAIARSAQAAVHLVCVRGSLTLDQEGSERAYLNARVEQLESELPGAVTAALLPHDVGPLQYPPPVAQLVAQPIAGHARARGIDFVVMATHGRGGLRSTSLGSVADVLVRSMACPVFLVRPTGESLGDTGDTPGLKHIVVAVDGSNTSQQVIESALDLGRPFAARYSLVHVVSPVDSASHPVAPSADALEHLEQLAARVREAGAVVEARVIPGVSPAPAIVAHAVAQKADAIAIATHGDAPPRRVLLGSTAADVVHNSRIPVLVCRIREVKPRTDSRTAVATPPLTPMG